MSEIALTADHVMALLDAWEARIRSGPQWKCQHCGAGYHLERRLINDVDLEGMANQTVPLVNAFDGWPECPPDCPHPAEAGVLHQPKGN